MSEQQTGVCWVFVGLVLSTFPVRLVSKLLWAWQKHVDNGRKLKYRKFRLNIKILFSHKGDQRLEQVAQGGCEVSTLWRYSKPKWTIAWASCFRCKGLGVVICRGLYQTQTSVSPRVLHAPHRGVSSRVISFDWQHNDKDKGKATPRIALLS